MSSAAPLPKLAGEQLAAADPAELVWLSASAGTGKTQVLSARVLRLLLRPDVKPEAILCLTFTKAGATEMAERINSRLAHWVMASGPEIARDLQALGEDIGPDTVKRARTLFASVLDARGGGLRIQTIHSFCQTLLSGFPAEAQLAPGFTLIEPRQEAALPMKVLSEMAVAAEREGRSGFGDRLRALGHLLDEDRVQRVLLRCAKAPDAMEALPAGDGLEPFVRRALCGIDDVTGELITLCSDPMPIRRVLDDYLAINRAWRTATGDSRVESIESWLAGSPQDRVASLDTLERNWVTAKRDIQKTGPKTQDCEALRAMLHAWCDPLIGLKIRARQAGEFAVMLSVGRDFARCYDDAKRAAGLVDYDDLIRKTVALLQTPGMGEWIRYKLDQSTDHILIDEAQDTNAAQWAIIKAIAGEFFAGSGARGDIHRTLFTVGDYKQAIFGFQGTDPKHFDDAQRHFDQAAKGAGRELRDLSLSRSFRSSAPVLDLVDELINGLGHEALGLQTPPPRHVSAGGGAGAVTLLAPTVDLGLADSGDGDDDEAWVPNAVRKIADEIADQVRDWLNDKLWLDKRKRAIEPQDVLILVRSRNTLAALIVARLHEKGVPVAGVDRLQLKLPIAVQDLLACVRFALQPLDDLNLAALLVSPLIGWTQEQLFDHAHARGDTRLWPHLRATLPDDLLQPLYGLLNAADFSTPYRFLEEILSGPMAGRRKLLKRLGPESRDPIEELLSAALEFEANHPPSLQIFLDWLDRGDVEIKRDAMGGGSVVRVMTVHGAKGLQAPIVILADATAKPKQAKGGDALDWRVDDALTLPLFRPRKDELTAALKAAAEISDEAETREHWRLLYVALTRAEERLIIGGALGPKAKGEVPEGSWYQAVDSALTRMGVVGSDRRKHYETAGAVNTVPMRTTEAAAATDIPDWLHAEAQPEARPPRPLAPSSLGKDDVANPPPAPAMQDAAERGRLLHKLFERLPGIALGDRAAVADHWLAVAEGVRDAAFRAALIGDALRVIGDPAYAALFGPDALAEAPIAGVVGGAVIAGTVDRLVISDDTVLVVDFKTGRRVPLTPEACPVPHLRQMAAYHALLSGIFPGRAVRAALLYTAGPMMHMITDSLIDQHKPDYSMT